MRITNNEAGYARNRRLMRVVEFFYDLMETHGCDQERGGKYEGMGSHPNGSTPIVAMHDHKGNLEVTWASQPSETEMRCIQTAWHEAGEEDFDDVTHTISEVQHGI